MAKTAAAIVVVEFVYEIVYDAPCHSLDSLNHKLCDSITTRDFITSCWVGVDHHDL